MGEVIDFRDFKGLKEIVTELDNLFAKFGVKNPKYQICIDPNQGAGLSSRDSLTRTAINQMDLDSKYQRLIMRLFAISRSAEYDYVVSRDWVYQH